MKRRAEVEKGGRLTCLSPEFHKLTLSWSVSLENGRPAWSQKEFRLEQAYSPLLSTSLACAKASLCAISASRPLTSLTLF
jgi:hypothetical protein